MLKINYLAIILSGAFTYNLNIISAEPKNKTEHYIYLTEKLEDMSHKVFFDRPISKWSKTEYENNDKSKTLVNSWNQLMEKIGDFITESGSRDLPPIYNKYFKPRYFGNKRSTPWTFVSDRSNDIFSDIFSQIALYNHLNGEKEKEKRLEADKKIEEIAKEINSSNKSIKKELEDVTTWFDAKTKAKDLLTQLTIILDKIYKELEPLTKSELPTESIPENLPIGTMQEIAKASIETNIKNAIDNPNVTQAAIFSETDNMFKAGGDSTRAILYLIKTEGNKRKQKDYHYGNFKHDIIEDLIKKRLKNTNPSRYDKIKEAKKLKATVWLKLENAEEEPLSTGGMVELLIHIASALNNEKHQAYIDYLRQRIAENLKLGANLNDLIKRESESIWSSYRGEDSAPAFFYITKIKNTKEQLDFTKFIIKNSKVPININATDSKGDTILHLLGKKISLFSSRGQIRHDFNDTEPWDNFELAKFYLDNFKNIKLNMLNKSGYTVLDCFTFLKSETGESFYTRFFSNDVNDYSKEGQKFILDIYNKGARFNLNKDGDKLIKALKKKYK